MNEFIDSFRLKIAEKIVAQVRQTFSHELQAAHCAADLAPVPDLKLGHAAFPCFKFAKALKKSPAAIAQELAAQWPEDPSFNEVKAAGPYLNFFIRPELFASHIIEPMRSGSYFKIPVDKDAKPFLIEYSQPNTHKELHVGHMRNLCYGLSLIALSLIHI